MRFVIAALLALLPCAAMAQSSPGLFTGQVPTAAQWNSYFAGKNDLITGTPGNIASFGAGGVVGDSGGAITATNLKFYGAKCDDVTDDTAALNSALSAAYAAGGKTLYVPSMCLISGAVVFPNNGASIPSQPIIRLTGVGSAANGTWGTLPSSPSGLDLRYNASVAKLDTRGSGILEIDHLTLEDKGTDCAPFIQTTNTTIRIHDVAFSGTAAGTSACNTGIILGGSNVTTGIVANGTATGAFQGYGSVIRDNFFDQMATIVLFNNWANSVQVVDNTISASSGNQIGDGAAFDFGFFTQGNYVAGNLIEETNYKYSFIFNNGAVQNAIIGNMLWDFSSNTVSSYACASGSASNFLMSGFDAMNTVRNGFGTCYNVYGNSTFSTGGTGAYSGFENLNLYTLNALSSTLAFGSFSTATQNFNFACDSNHQGLQIGLQTGQSYIQGCGTGGTFGLYAAGNSNVNIGTTTYGSGLEVASVGAATVDYLRVKGASTGNAVQIQAGGSDANISINLQPQGTGTLQIGGVAAVSCTAGTVSLTTLTVTDGIITHC